MKWLLTLPLNLSIWPKGQARKDIAMNFQFKKLAKGFRIITHKGKPIGTLEFTKGKWLALSGVNPEYRRYFTNVKQAKVCCNADPKFYFGIGA